MSGSTKIHGGSYGLHWFRRDLRIRENPALLGALDRYEGRVVCFFSFDKKFLARDDFSPPRFQFFLLTLEKLSAEIRENGGELIFLDEGPDQAFERLFTSLRDLKQPLPESVSFNRDYEPFALERDRRVSRWLRQQSIDVVTERDHLLIEPSELCRDNDPSLGYQVFTPFQKRWLSLFGSDEVRTRLSPRSRPKRTRFQLTWSALGIAGSHGDLLSNYREKNSKLVNIAIPASGSEAVDKALRSFEKKIHQYAEKRDFPNETGTSHFSIYLKNGSLTIARIIHDLGLESFKTKPVTGSDKFLSELIWREFYYHILARHPYVEKGAFQQRFDSIAWENREDHFSAWCEGRTGYPLVDAGMRQLARTGWMHNRVRMVVASFLVKDLLINWQWGERYFMKYLLDGDLAPNNGGWQWAASTGCDPQPYFRIFNPVLQSQKFDPQGHYIRHYIPELSHLHGKSIHFPTQEERRNRYPAPIVFHENQRPKALALFKIEV